MLPDMSLGRNQSEENGSVAAEIVHEDGRSAVRFKLTDAPQLEFEKFLEDVR